MANKYKVAVIGAGDMGTNHVNGWKLAGHEVVSITDTNQERAEQLAKEAGISHVFTDYRDAVAAPEVDIVSVCLPLKAHAEVTIAAAGYGKHVFCEKPIASSLEEAERMREATEKAGVQLGLGFQRNLAHGVELVTNWVREGKFGRPMFLTSDLMQEVRPKRVMHDKYGNQGPIVDTACHFFYMWETIFGAKAKSIYARGAVMAEHRPEIAHFKERAIDTGVITVEYESGDVAQLTICWGLAKDTKLGSRMDRIIGPLGAAEGYFNTWGRDAGEEIRLFIGDTAETVKLEKRELFKLQFEAFVDAIEQGREVPVGWKQGTDMLKLSYAALESIATGEVVKL